MATSIDVLNLTCIASESLRGGGFYTVEQLEQLKEKDLLHHLLKVPGFGKKSLSEVENALNTYVKGTKPSFNVEACILENVERKMALMEKQFQEIHQLIDELNYLATN